MKKIKDILCISLMVLLCVPTFAQDANEILRKVDANISANNRVAEASIVVKGKRNTRTFTTKNYLEGTVKAFTEYLQPARERGTKMLKLGKEMWIYSPSTDRTIMISGHMLRQAVMGSDMSYEDMMEDRKLHEMYDAVIDGKEEIEGKHCHKLKLTAKLKDVAYYSCIMWVDVERCIPLRQDYYAKSGQLLKRLCMFDFQRVDGKWTPMRSNYKDMMKDGEGTDMIVKSIKYNQDIPASLFTKGALKK